MRDFILKNEQEDVSDAIVVFRKFVGEHFRGAYEFYKFENGNTISSDSDFDSKLPVFTKQQFLEMTKDMLFIADMKEGDWIKCDNDEEQKEIQFLMKVQGLKWHDGDEYDERPLSFFSPPHYYSPFKGTWFAHDQIDSNKEDVKNIYEAKRFILTPVKETRQQLLVKLAGTAITRDQQASVFALTMTEAMLPGQEAPDDVIADMYLAFIGNEEGVAVLNQLFPQEKQFMLFDMKHGQIAEIEDWYVTRLNDHFIFTGRDSDTLTSTDHVLMKDEISNLPCTLFEEDDALELVSIRA